MADLSCFENGGVQAAIDEMRLRLNPVHLLSERDLATAKNSGHSHVVLKQAQCHQITNNLII